MFKNSYTIKLVCVMEDFVCKRISAQVSIKSTSGLIFLCVKVAACKASVCKRVPCAETARARARVCAQVSACTKPPLLSSAVKSQTCQERVEYQDSGFSREGLVKKNVKETQGQRDVKIQKLSGERVARERDANGKLDQEI